MHIVPYIFLRFPPPNMLPYNEPCKFEAQKRLETLPKPRLLFPMLFPKPDIRIRPDPSKRLSKTALAPPHIDARLFIPGTPTRSDPSPLVRIHLPPLPPPLLDRLLPEMAEPVPSPKAHIHQAPGIDQAARDRLHDLEDLHGVADGLDFRLADLEDGEGDAEEGLAALVEESVPDAEDGFDGQGADEAGHEPGRRAERDGREPVDGRDGAVEVAGHFGPDGRHAFFDAGHQDPEVDVGAFEADFVRAGEVDRRDDDQHPEGFFLGHEEEEQAGEEVEGLAVADARVVD